MINRSIPANADNKVVAGENANVMTKEILEGFVREAVAGYIDNLVDATWEGYDEYSRIEEDWDDNLWVSDMQFDYNAGTYEAIEDDIQEMCDSEGYDIDLDDMISVMADRIVEDNDELEWFHRGCADYLGVLYKSHSERSEESIGDYDR